jgi:flavin reductase (DIM6/NTAB) family NADH-FMN oxidoreductase RutF
VKERERAPPYNRSVRKNLEEIDARRLLSGGPVVLVTSSHRGRHNVMPVAYVMVLSLAPPVVGLAISPQRHTFDVIKMTEEFAINIPSRQLLHHVQYLGALSGVEYDKLELTKLPYFRARKLDTILLEGCVGWIECGLQDMVEMGDHHLVVGNVVAVSADDEAFGDRWLLQDEDEKPLHYLGANFYSTLGRVLEARVPKPAEEYERRLQEAADEQLELSKDDAERRAEEEYERDEFIRREGFSAPE